MPLNVKRKVPHRSRTAAFTGSYMFERRLQSDNLWKSFLHAIKVVVY